MARISVLVHRGQPLDYQMYRHTAIFIQFQDDSPPLLVQISEPNGEYEFDCVPHYKPESNADLVKTIDVGFLRVAIEPATLARTMATVRIDNHDREFNCQTWVEMALKRLRDLELLTPEAYSDGVDGMVDAIAEAEDDREE